MKKILQAIGGAIIAAAAVLIVVNLYSGGVMEQLKQEGMGIGNTGTKETGEEYKKAVLADPHLQYQGKVAARTDAAIDLYGEVQFLDNLDHYESSLADAVQAGRASIQGLEIIDVGQEEGTAQADIDEDAGSVKIHKSGVYRIRISATDCHNNPVKTDFLIAVNRKGA